MDLDDLLRRFRGPLIGLIHSFGAPWGDAEELAQDTFAEAYLARERFRGDFAAVDQVGAWLRGIAFNVFSHWARRSRRRNEVLAESLPDRAAPGVSDAVDAVRAAIDRLPGPLRAVITMHYLHESKVRDVAALLGVSEKTVESRLYQARRRLRELLASGPLVTPERRIEP